MHSVVDFTNVFVLVYLVNLVLKFATETTLEVIDYRHRRKNGGIIPDILKKYPQSSVFDQEKLKRISEYEDAKFFVWLPRRIITFLLDMGLVVFGFYVLVFNLVTSWFGMPSGIGSTFLCFLLFNIIISIPESVLDLPFSLYVDFGLEKKFGFSNMTAKLWISDKLKNAVLGAVLLALLSIVAAVFMVKCPNSWWWIIAAIFVAFTVLVNIIYPKFIAPMFNKFNNLEEGELRTRLEAMLAKAGFSSGGLYSMDASKRSKHSNAYFSGFGKAKQIVLYDTLINSMEPAEIESVMAHEVGHYKLHHITTRLVMMFPMIVIAFAVLFWFSHVPSLYTGFGFPASDINAMQFVGLHLAILVYSSLGYLVSPVTNAFSRKHEYAADNYSAKLCGTGKPLVTALIKLNSENLSEILPPKVYSFYHYSHPTLVERISALEAVEAGLQKQ